MSKEKIEKFRSLITEEIIKTDFENKKNNSIKYIRISKIDYLKRLLEFLKILGG